MLYIFGVEPSASHAFLAVVAFVCVDILRREAFVFAVGTHEMSIRIASVVTSCLVLPLLAATSFKQAEQRCEFTWHAWLGYFSAHMRHTLVLAPGAVDSSYELSKDSAVGSATFTPAVF